MNNRLANSQHGGALSQRHSASRRPRKANLVIGQPTKVWLYPTDKRGYTVRNMRSTLLAASIRKGRSAHCGFRDLPLTCRAKSGDVLSALLATQERGPRLGRTLRGLLFPGVSAGHFRPNLYRGAVSRSSLSPGGRISEWRTLSSVVRDPSALRLLPVPKAGFKNYHLRLLLAGEKRLNPVSLVGSSSLRGVNVPLEPFGWVERPADVSSGLSSRINQAINEPNTLFIHALSIAQFSPPVQLRWRA